MKQVSPLLCCISLLLASCQNATTDSRTADSQDHSSGTHEDAADLNEQQLHAVHSQSHHDEHATGQHTDHASNPGSGHKTTDAGHGHQHPTHETTAAHVEQNEHSKSDVVHHNHSVKNRNDGPNKPQQQANQKRPEDNGVATTQLDDELANADAGTVFRRRILPILQSDNASSCTECHFAGVELRDYILEDQAKTFASLKQTGMINVERPDESKILRFINRKPEKPNALTERVRQQEFVAFRAWIRAAVREPELLTATSDVSVGTSLPLEVVRHARKDRVLASFIDNIWSETSRCMNCHSPDLNRGKIGRDGFTKEDVDAISWIVPHDPAGTLQKLIDTGNIDTSDPAASQVLTKPSGREKHGGGPKFFPGSPTYHNFLSFLTDFAAIDNKEYRTVNDLPEPSKEYMRLSQQQLRFKRIPEEFKGLPMQVDIFRWDPERKQRSEHRWATAFSRVNPKDQAWQNPILVTAPANSPLSKQFRERPLLPTGTYRARVYVDQDRKTEANPNYELGENEFITEVEISDEWPPGFRPPKVILFPRKLR